MERNTITQSDALELCASLEPQSVDFAYIPFACYNPYSTQGANGMNEKTICRLYVEEGYTLRRIAERFNTDHHTIRRVLVRNGVEITQVGRKRKPFTDEHRRKMSERMMGRSAWNEGRKASEAMRRANMKGKLQTSIDLDKYPDYARLLFLTGFLSKRKPYIGGTDAVREQFLDRFYFDAQFNRIYDAWIASGKNRWYRPTLDHKHALANGGAWAIDNLQFLTWFENRAKADMNEDEWLRFCKETNTTSNLFIRASNG